MEERQVIHLPCTTCGHETEATGLVDGARIPCASCGGSLEYRCLSNTGPMLQFPAEDIPLREAVMTIGRLESCAIRIPGEHLSRIHCRLYKRGGRIFLEDVGSVNGTYVNGRRLAPGVSVALQGGDLIRLHDIPVRFLAGLDIQGDTKIDPLAR